MIRKKWQGYVFSREINEHVIPQRVQNLLIRNYISNFDVDFVLSATEYNLQGCFFSLWAVVDSFVEIDGVVFYSVHMMPMCREDRLRLYELAFKHNVQLHFALEEMSIKVLKDTDIIEDLLIINQIAKKINFNSIGYDHLGSI